MSSPTTTVQSGQTHRLDHGAAALLYAGTDTDALDPRLAIECPLMDGWPTCEDSCAMVSSCT